MNLGIPWGRAKSGWVQRAPVGYSLQATFVHQASFGNLATWGLAARCSMGLITKRSPSPASRDISSAGPQYMVQYYYCYDVCFVVGCSMKVSD